MVFTQTQIYHYVWIPCICKHEMLRTSNAQEEAMPWIFGWLSFFFVDICVVKFFNWVGTSHLLFLLLLCMSVMFLLLRYSLVKVEIPEIIIFESSSFDPVLEGKTFVIDINATLSLISLGKFCYNVEIFAVFWRLLYTLHFDHQGRA